MRRVLLSAPFCLQLRHTSRFTERPGKWEHAHYVVISGTATCNDQDFWDEARLIIERYRAADEVDDSVARWQTEPRVLITITPEHIATRESRGR